MSEIAVHERRGWRSYCINGKRVEIRRMNNFGGYPFASVVENGLNRGYRYLIQEELKRVLSDSSRTTGFVAVPSSPWDCRVYQVLPSGQFQLTTHGSLWLEAQKLTYSVLMAED